MVIEVVVGTMEFIQGRGSFMFSKLDLPLFKGLSSLFFIKMEQEWVGGIFLHHKSIALLNIASKIVIMDLVLCSTHPVS